MIADHGVTVMLPAKDTTRARLWYEETLGLKPDRITDYGATYTLTGGTPMFLYETPFAGSAGHTLLSFASNDLIGDMRALRAKGVTFEDYDLPNLRTVDGVAEFGPVKNAWFKDSEGNILGLVEGM
ncbi:MAG TPA: VOC family protein [Alphaproteobacteria bacterium]|nr:VOC family protein [Alphaproteobacteria bacterium]